MKNKNLSFDDRLEIEKGLKENKSFKAIGTIINKDCTTISKEIKNHIVFKDVGTVWKSTLTVSKGKIAHLDKKERFAILTIVSTMKN